MKVCGDKQWKGGMPWGYFQVPIRLFQVQVASVFILIKKLKK